MESSKKFFVRILCMAYNHESYIRDAMTGFVMQNTGFPFVAVIVDDASTDKTGETIIQFVNDHFVLDDSIISRIEEKEYGRLIFAQHKTNENCFFAVILLKENHFQHKKSKSDYYLEWSDAKYYALCEGDDYWTDPCKLQKQVEYLDTHPGCMLTVHSAAWRTNDKLYPGGCQDLYAKDYSIEELIRSGGYHFATASFVFRSELGYDWPEWRRKAGVGDFPLEILAGLHGDVHYLPDRMCVYRFQHEGSWSLNLQRGDAHITFYKNKIEWMTLLNEATGFQFQNAIYDQLFSHFNALYNLREISFWDYAIAVYRSGEKKYRRLINDFIRIELSPLYRILSRIFKK